MTTLPRSTFSRGTANATSAETSQASVIEFDEQESNIDRIRRLSQLEQLTHGSKESPRARLAIDKASRYVVDFEISPLPLSESRRSDRNA